MKETMHIVLSGVGVAGSHASPQLALIAWEVPAAECPQLIPVKQLPVAACSDLWHSHKIFCLALSAPGS